MKSPSDILRYLDEYYARMIRRPTGYAVSPAAMEGQIGFIERLRAFILNDPKQWKQYNRFILSLGYGSRGVAYTPDSPSRISDNDRVVFQRVASVLEQFLRNEGRTGAIPGEAAGSAGDPGVEGG